MITYKKASPKVSAALAIGSFFLTAAPAYAVSFVAAQSVGEQSTASLIGLDVQNAQSESLGDINYLVLDANGAVTTVVIGVGGFLGVGEKNVGVPFKELKMVSNKDGKRVAMVDATKDTLTAAPNYVWTEKSAVQQIREGAGAAMEKAGKAISADPDRTAVTPATPPAATQTP